MKLNGKDYYFISREEFQERIDRGEFIEWVENYRQLYGSSRKTMEEFIREWPRLIAGYRTAGSEKD